jgi:CspA family cold shock protein
MSDRLIGVCKWFNNERGYGFVYEADKEAVEYFVHYSSIEMDGYKTIKAGQKISFEIKETEKGIQAVNVKPE